MVNFFHQNLYSASNSVLFCAGYMNSTPPHSKSSFQVKLIHVFLDDAAISPSEGFLIRKGPGNCHFDFAQEILFIDYLQTPTDNKTAEDYHKYGPPNVTSMPSYSMQKVNEYMNL